MSFTNSLKPLGSSAHGSKIKRASDGRVRSVPHYDLTPSKRAQAIAAGAQECDSFALVSIGHKLRDEMNTKEQK